MKRRLEKYLSAAAVVLRNTVLGGSLAAVSLLRQPRKALLFVNETLFLYQTFAGRRRLPQRPVLEAFGQCSTAEIRLARLPGKMWFHSLASYAIDLVSLCWVCRAIEPRVVFEIGTLEGYTALHFALNTPPEARVYTPDLPPDAASAPLLPTTLMDDVHIQGARRRHGYLFDSFPERAKITCLYGDSASFDFSPYSGQVDLFFIDGAHSYEYVRADTLNALRCTRPGGVILWHDYGRVGVNGVSRWLHELARQYDIACVPGGSLAYLVVPAR